MIVQSKGLVVPELYKRSIKLIQLPDKFVRNHNGLVNEIVTVLSHLVQNLVRSILARLSTGLTGHSQWVD